VARDLKRVPTVRIEDIELLIMQKKIESFEVKLAQLEAKSHTASIATTEVLNLGLNYQWMYPKHEHRIHGRLQELIMVMQRTRG
jgi:hypothetical protein